jgi:hypothetical protein
MLGDKRKLQDTPFPPQASRFARLRNRPTMDSVIVCRLLVLALKSPVFWRGRYVLVKNEQSDF